MRVLVCGSRDWTDSSMVHIVLSGLYWKGNPDPDRPWMTVIDGGAKGADEAAGSWAKANKGIINHLVFAADWETYGKAAGPIRNRQMLDEGQPDVVVAFSEQPPTPGTANMIKQAKEHGIPVWVVSHG